jgi:hypothetical protein
VDAEKTLRAKIEDLSQEWSMMLRSKFMK